MKKVILIIISIIAIIGIIFLINKNKNISKSKIKNEDKSVEKYSDEIYEEEKVILEELKNVFNKTEEEYQDAKLKYDGYKRSDFYNETRVNMKLNNSEISFVSNINSDEIYDVSGNKEESMLAELKISSDSLVEENNIYLLRVSSNSSEYVYYYTFKIDNNGKVDINLINYTKNELSEEMNVISSEDIEYLKSRWLSH